MSSLASEDSLCRGGKEGGPQPLSWGLSDCGGRQHSHQRQPWQPGLPKLLGVPPTPTVMVKMSVVMAALTVGCSL